MPTSKLPRLYFENAVGGLYEHPNGYVIFRYHPGKRKFADFQALLTHTSNLLQRNGWNRLLGDQRQMSPHTEEETAWIVANWLGGYRQRNASIYGAVLLAQDVFARLSMNQILHDARESALVYHVFDDEAKAIDWLNQIASESTGDF
ncbi:hypothetical protein CDA63_11995 [Hymenobacter amundsenii]|uniref:STAS/SEC14 domain-containing protein n=2 Tax=Hymenobacter amundsenii TaxID=2006685 RepID=A0A246FMV0_9BACT|nr:hypothetical protein CDA63_11995 [Hymenobacter amundsenii]